MHPWAHARMPPGRLSLSSKDMLAPAGLLPTHVSTAVPCACKGLGLVPKAALPERAAARGTGPSGLSAVCQSLVLLLLVVAGRAVVAALVC
eukprot:15453441-Alexandrium_andersonii.AAC.1